MVCIINTFKIKLLRNLLFISHEATRTGAPMLLLNLIKWFSMHKKSAYKLTVLIIKGGPLISEFEKYSTVICYNNRYSKRFYFLNSFLNKQNQKINISWLQTAHWDLIFSNTIVNGQLLELLANSQAPIVSYIHELEFSIKKFLQQGLVQGTFLHSNFFICGSEMVRENLIKNHNVSRSQTDVVYSFTDISDKEVSVSTRDEIKKQLAIPSDALVVGMMGNFDWRKGADIFVKTASLLASENIVFLWIGANNQAYLDRINYDLNMLNKQVKILFIPPSADYAKYYHAIDLFFLSSREDPYPMVMIEATAFGIPIICFNKAGGTQEFVDDRVGFAVPYGDVTAAAEKIKHFQIHNHLLELNRAYIQEKSIKQHDVEKNALHIFSIIENQLSS